MKRLVKFIVDHEMALLLMGLFVITLAAIVSGAADTMNVFPTLVWVARGMMAVGILTVIVVLAFGKTPPPRDLP